jgi:hypothetical protein
MQRSELLMRRDRLAGYPLAPKGVNSWNERIFIPSPRDLQVDSEPELRLVKMGGRVKHAQHPGATLALDT